MVKILFFFFWNNWIVVSYEQSNEYVCNSLFDVHRKMKLKVRVYANSSWCKLLVHQLVHRYFCGSL